MRQRQECVTEFKDFFSEFLTAATFQKAVTVYHP